MALRQYETYIFDLDGTLLDTLDDLAASTNHALRTMGMPMRSREEVRCFVGNGVRKLIERAVPPGTGEETTEATLECFRKHYLKHSLDNTRPYPGVIPMLEELKRRGRQVAVVSNKFNAATEELCRLFFGQLIDVAIGEKEGIRRKPAPDTVLAAMNALGAEPESTVYVGDSDVDLMTARNSHLPCISVLWGFRDKKFLEQHGAETFIQSPKEIL